jgi:hypothetical protein
MAKEPKHYLNEPDIGSGEYSAGQEDVQRDVASVHNSAVGKPQDGSQFKDVVEEQEYAEQRHPEAEHQRNNAQSQNADRVLQSNTHLARFTIYQLMDGSYEAQVYVRLTSEPEIAETYIPAGTFPTELEAWNAAEQRATRALKEHEF